MVTDHLPIDITAFEAIDRQRLLRVLTRAIDEETACRKGREGRERMNASEGEPERLQVLSTLVGMIQDMIDTGLNNRPPSSKGGPSGR